MMRHVRGRKNCGVFTLALGCAIWVVWGAGDGVMPGRMDGGGRMLGGGSGRKTFTLLGRGVDKSLKAGKGPHFVLGR
jgi:hypothetical protein